MDGFEGWLGRLRADEAAAARRRERWLQRQSGEDATVAGLLLGFGERRCPVLVTTTSGRSHGGVVVAVGDGFLALKADNGAPVLVRTGALALVRPQTGGGAPAAQAGLPGDDRLPPLGVNFAEALAALAAERPRVLVVTEGGTHVAGCLVQASPELVAVQPDGRHDGRSYLVCSSVAEVSLTGSG